MTTTVCEEHFHEVVQSRFGFGVALTLVIYSPGGGPACEMCGKPAIYLVYITNTTFTQHWTNPIDTTGPAPVYPTNWTWPQIP